LKSCIFIGVDVLLTEVCINRMNLNFFIGRLLNRGSVGIRIKSMNEPVRVMAIVGSCRRGGMIYQAVEEIPASAGRPGASGGPP